ncbi:hypothetical protein CC78DRAFT_150203 [Lojkania enalia]|uniref:Tetratricopeptide repeat protein n=1 Tax=Lojkania enalia TaxID=147567 RepID=A0A9P4JYC1_9PLEO|nr:hypothetical protein CC78DRAFT_150203 [Didymosphaeria enalia]
MGILYTHPLADAKADTDGYKMHTVLYKWCYHVLNANKSREMFSLAAAMIYGYIHYNRDSDFWEKQRRTRSHAMSIGSWIMLLSSGNTADRKYEVSELYTQSIQEYENRLGTSSLDSYYPLHNLGNVYWRQGKLNDGESFAKSGITSIRARTRRIW